MEQEMYKKLYYHAFNRYTELLEQVQTIQQELEELYLCLEDEDELQQKLAGQSIGICQSNRPSPFQGEGGTA